MNYNERRAATAESAFLARLTKLGATSLEPAWTGNRAPHRVRCPEGHLGAPWPSNVMRGQGVCNTCAHRSTSVARTSAAESAFRTLLDELGATLTGPWKGTRAPHSVLCPAGHECAPTPTNLKRGSGLCRLCAGKVWDVFYVVASHDMTKFGITSGDPRPRLRQHQKAGLNCIGVWTKLPGIAAPSLERELIDLLNEAGVQAVKGREYFPANCLDFVMDVVTDRIQPLGG